MFTSVSLSILLWIVNGVASAETLEEARRAHPGVRLAIPSLYEALGETKQAGTHHKRWGEIEVVDAGALLEHLAGLDLIDPARAFIRGASAGGYTALCALAGGLTFRGGASLYGVSDPLALRRVTHKFEADYLDWLIGDPQRDAQRYAARTPLLHADKIEAPVIFFQGGQDAVVLPSQTEAMVEALRGRGLAVDYHFYPEEGHGFRQACNQAHALEQEWCFYQRLLG